MSLKIIPTSDESPTLYNDELDETYHSRHGAYRESVYVYIKMGLDELTHLKNIKVFEMGFGTGLNQLLTWEFAEQHQIKVDVTTIELYPLEEKIWKQLAYYRNEEEKEIYKQLHEAEWEQEHNVSKYLNICKKKTSLFDFNADEVYHIIYWDAFGPEVQPDLWTLEVFQKLYDFLWPEGILVTYSAKGQVRRNMIAAGFEVSKLPGPPGKREMLRAVKPI